MKFFTTTISLMLLLAVSACAQGKYKLTADLEAPEGTTAYIVNMDDEQLVDSALVSAEGTAFFKGDIDEPIMAYVVMNGKAQYGPFILEEGATKISKQTGRPSGLMLNDQLNVVMDSIMAIVGKLRAASTEQQQEALYEQYLASIKQAMNDNLDNPIGYYMLINAYADMDANEVLDIVNANPYLAQYQKVQAIAKDVQVQAATSEGKPFVDFEVEYDGKVQKLSEYVGNGKFTLVDFWASWCGPCRAEMPTLKEIYNEYSDKGLQVLGVAVWDKPEDTLAAIKELDLPWPVIINAQRVPTDAYGISGIPCIILFGPDGVIVNRGARGEQLKAVVAEAMKANL